MTRTRALLLLWLVLGALVWNAVFDLWMVSETRQYLLTEALWELGRAPAPALLGSMETAARTGALRVSVLVFVIVSAGLITVRTRK